MLIRHFSRHFSRFVRPNIHRFESVFALEKHLYSKELSQMQELNEYLRKRDMSYTRQKELSDRLNLPQPTASSIADTNYLTSVFNTIDHRHFEVERNVGSGQVRPMFSVEEVNYPMHNHEHTPSHFSLERGAPVLKEYEELQNGIYIFNLPESADTKLISQVLGSRHIKKVTISYCVLGLPAYAKVEFNSSEMLNNIILSNQDHYEIDGRDCYLITFMNRDTQKLENRRLAIMEVPSQLSPEELLVELSQYGRVLHLDMPEEISRNCSLEQFKQLYDPKKGKVKINYHRADGTIESEFYPPVEPVKMEDLKSSNLQRLEEVISANKEEQFKLITGFPPQVNLYQRNQDINYEPQGYCIVTYASCNEAKNCYFNMRYKFKMSLMRQKEEFQVDTAFRKKVLRFIDRHFRAQKKETLESDKMLEITDAYKAANLYEILCNYEDYEERTKNTNLYKISKHYMQLNPYVQEALYEQKLKKIRQSVGKQMKSAKTFDEIVEQQIFGRTLQKKAPIKIEDRVDYELKLYKELPKYPQMSNYTAEDVLEKREKEIRRKQRSQRLHKYHNPNAEGETLQLDDGEGDEENQPEEIEAVQKIPSKPKKHFSTFTVKQQSYRDRTLPQQADYNIRYSEFIRDLINQYLGVFSQDTVEKSFVQEPASYINPQEFQFQDGKPFITQEQLPKIMGYHRDFKEAQEVFENYFETKEYYSSKNITPQQILKKTQGKLLHGQLQLSDFGLIKEVYEVQEGLDAAQQVKVLNATEAAFGEQFILQENEGKTFILKVVKLEEIYPLHRISVLEKVMQQTQFDPKIEELVGRHLEGILTTGKIPEELCAAFGMKVGSTLDDVLTENPSITKKDLESLFNMRNYSEEELSKSYSRQIEMEKIRNELRESESGHFAKDPSNIEVKDKEGFFKVSKFRQI